MTETPDLEAARAAALERLRLEAGRAPARDNGHPPQRPDELYAGLATRTIAYSVDAAIITGVAAVTGVFVGLGLSILHLPSQVDSAIAAVLAVVLVLWNIGYFVLFWSSTGQTPGNRLMHIRVVDRRTGGTIKPVRAALRFGALILAVIPLGAGIFRMLFDDRRRCFQDRFARTLVVYVPVETETPTPLPAVVTERLTPVEPPPAGEHNGGR